MTYIPSRRGMGDDSNTTGVVLAVDTAAGIPPPCSIAQVGQQCTPDTAPNYTTCPDGSMVPAGVACPPPSSAWTTPPTPGLPWCSQAKPGQACNPDTASQAAGLSAAGALTKSLFGQTGLIGTLTSPLGLAAIAGGVFLYGKRKRR